MSVKIHNTKDFTLGIRGGDWYAFPNTMRGRELRKLRRVPLSSSSKNTLMLCILDESATFEVERESLHAKHA